MDGREASYPGDAFHLSRAILKKESPISVPLVNRRKLSARPSRRGEAFWRFVPWITSRLAHTTGAVVT